MVQEQFIQVKYVVHQKGNLVHTLSTNGVFNMAIKPK